MIYNQLIKSTIDLFGEVEANALYLKKIKLKTKQKSIETVEFFTKEESLKPLSTGDREKNEVTYNDEKELIPIMPIMYKFFD